MRLRRTRREPDEVGGDDAFLDIVANLVGVLIILVVVVGAKAGTTIHQMAINEVDEAELSRLQEDHETTLQHARKLLQDNHQLEDKVLLERRLAETRRLERNRLLLEIEQARQEIAAKKSQLSENHRRVLEHSEQIATLRQEFRDLDSQYTSLQSVSRQKETIEHFPTPIAKTVFSEEIHFRLRAGRLAYVPMNELVELMRDEWKEKARKLQNADETLETVGPIGDFRLQYHLHAEDRQLPPHYGESTERVIEFTRFVMVPVNDQIGAAMPEALQEGSEFRSWIDLATPDSTTVSVWVYPDSFEEFNGLKKWLYERGFKTACWPLSANSPISGGPSGYRSTAQ